MALDGALVLTLVSGAASLAASSSFITWFMAREFSKNRELMWKQLGATKKEILDKLEYHEQHDDARFIERDKRLWTLEIWKAGVTGGLPREFPKGS